MKLKQKQNHHFDDFDINFEKVRRKRSGVDTQLRVHNPDKVQHREQQRQEFRCLQCGQAVSTSRESSGVNNRNHCPVCLWSRHVDQIRPGDRRSECRSRMEPVGLTVKHTCKRYGQENTGELMLVHRCAGCGKLSINRVAADDNAARIYTLFLQTQCMDAHLLSVLKSEGITPLQAGDLTTVHTQLFGWQSILDEFRAVEDSALVPGTSLVAHLTE